MAISLHPQFFQAMFEGRMLALCRTLPPSIMAVYEKYASALRRVDLARARAGNATIAARYIYICTYVYEFGKL